MFTLLTATKYDAYPNPDMRTITIPDKDSWVSLLPLIDKSATPMMAMMIAKIRQFDFFSL